MHNLNSVVLTSSLQRFDSLI